MRLKEFENKIAIEFGLTAAEFRERGWVVVPCGCGNEDCSGWRPAHPAADLAAAAQGICDQLHRITGFADNVGETLRDALREIIAKTLESPEMREALARYAQSKMPVQ